jgi:DNA-binding transcriptional MerR regulator
MNEVNDLTSRSEAILKYKQLDTKLYYSISEISEQFDVSKSLIRFWETEFSILKPRKNSKGERRFTKKDIEDFKIIYHLVKEKGFTLEGANKEIEQNKERIKQKFKILENLKTIKTYFEAEKDALGS